MTGGAAMGMRRPWVVVSVLWLGAWTGCGSKDPEDTHGTGGSGGRTAQDAGDRGGAGIAADDDAGGGGPEACPDGPLLPMAVGNTWTYRVVDAVGGVTTKTTTVEGMELVGGSGPNASKTAFRVTTMKASGSVTDLTESWQDVLADGSVVRYRELGYSSGTTQVNTEDVWDPYKLRVDQSPEHTTIGAAWNEQYLETKTQNGITTAPAARNDGWVVDDVGVPCGPVDGQSLTCVKLRKTIDGAASGKTYYFARCVGKVREEGVQVEELTDFSLK